MSRLYEALTRVVVNRSQPGTAQVAVSASKALKSTRIPVETSPGYTKTAEALSEGIADPTEPATADGAATSVKILSADDAPSITVMAPATSRLVAWSDSTSLGAEKFRALVTRLDHMRRQIKLQSLQVTSSVVGEGKTLVAANLAVTLAKYSGSKTLLIEGDLHRPAQASLFGLRELRGLANWWFEQDHEIGHFLYRFNGMPLWFLPAGKVHDQPSDLLRSPRFAAAFAELAGSFDWIVVDSTPMLPIVDVNLWSRLVNGTLLVVRETVTPVKDLKKGLQALDQPKLIGVVINEASEVDQAKYEGQFYGAPKVRSKTGTLDR